MKLKRNYLRDVMQGPWKTQRTLCLTGGNFQGNIRSILMFHTPKKPEKQSPQTSRFVFQNFVFFHWKKWCFSDTLPSRGKTLRKMVENGKIKSSSLFSMFLWIFCRINHWIWLRRSVRNGPDHPPVSKGKNSCAWATNLFLEISMTPLRELFLTR